MKLSLGEKLQDLRKQKGKTTKQVCSDTGLSEGVLNGLENDKGADVGYSKIITLCKYYDVSADYLLGLSENKTNNIELRAICEYTGLSDITIEKIKDLNRFSYDNNEIYLERPKIIFEQLFIYKEEFAELLLLIDKYLELPVKFADYLRKNMLDEKGELLPYKFKEMDELTVIKQEEEPYCLWKAQKQLGKLLEAMYMCVLNKESKIK